MILLLTGATHCGKTHFAKVLVKETGYMCISLDHLKMGLIRSGVCKLSPEDSDEVLTEYLWKIVREMIKTAIENSQDLIIEGCYIPFDYFRDFDADYLCRIKYLCLIFSESYINNHFDDILFYANVSEKRLDDSYCTKELLLRDNARNLEMCKKFGVNYLLTDEKYPSEIKF